MLTTENLLIQLKRLWRNTANPPAPDTLPELCADWMDLLGEHLDDAGLAAAVRAHLGRSRFWPTPAELLTAAPAIVASSPVSIKARADQLFPLTIKARSSCPDPLQAPRHLAHYGVTDPAEQAACIAATGGWKSWDPGDPNRGGDPRRYEFARRDFAASLALRLPEARDGRLALPAPPALRLLAAGEA